MGKVGTVIFVILFAGVALFFGLRKENAASDDAREFVATEISGLPAYERRSDYLEELLEANHDSAFSRNYSGGSRRRRASFDEDGYYDEVLERMAKQADLDKMDEIAEQLRGLKDDILGLPGD